MNATSAGTAREPDTSAAPVNWIELVERIRGNDPAGMEELYRMFTRGIRFHLCRQLGPQDLDDKVHDVFLIVIQALQRGDLRAPDRLMGFVRTVVRRQVAAQIGELVHSRHQHVNLDCGAAALDTHGDPEQQAMRNERASIAGKALNSVSRRDREVLTRFYLQEQTQEQICAEMNITETQFRLLKSRAKARFGELGRRRLGGRPGPRFR